jgi:hypothetical protein
MLRLIACSLALASTGTVVTALSSASSNRRAFIQTSGAAAAAAVVGTVLPANAVSQANVPAVGGKPIYGKEDIMSPKSHGTSDAPVQSELLYGVSNNLADRITNYNRRFAEQAGYFVSTSLEDTIRNHVEKTGGQPLAFYDSVTGKPLFVAPVGRSVDQFLEESKIHGTYLFLYFSKLIIAMQCSHDIYWVCVIRYCFDTVYYYTGQKPHHLV